MASPSTFLNSDYYLFRLESNLLNHEELTRFQNLYATYIQFRQKDHFHLGFPIQLRDSLEAHSTFNWFCNNPKISLFYYLELKPHQSIKAKLKKHKLTEIPTIHILPSSDLEYQGYRSELWDLHLEGYTVFFHHLNEVKSFRRKSINFEKLSNRGVFIGITPKWPFSIFGNNKTKIQSLIADHNVHFFNTEKIEIDPMTMAKLEILEASLTSVIQDKTTESK